MGSKRLNLEKEEDRISALPDSIIQHILSFLPSTKDSLRTGILSKRWQNQWTQVPLLIFNSNGMSYANFLKFIDCTLIFHDCSKIKKFHLEYHYPDRKDPDFASKIRFATRKHVEKLTLSPQREELLPTFLFDHDSLVELNAVHCSFMPNRKVNWRCLAALSIVDCRLTEEAIEHILSGSPSLESLELCPPFSQFDELVIASKSLKILDLRRVSFDRIEISCPNLEKLSLRALGVRVGPELFARAIENVLSHSLLLESFELRNCSGGFFVQILKLVIASKSLKRLVLEDLRTSAGALEISCPNLEQLKLFGSLSFETAKLLNLPSSLCATVDSYLPYRELIEDVLQSLQHVKQLEIGDRLFKPLSKLKGGWSLPLLNTKCLILNSGDLNEYPYQIAHILRTFHVLEELVIKVPHCYPEYLSHYHENYDYHEQLNDTGENYWNSDKTVFKCLVSHLKTLKIIGFPYRDHNRKLVLNFVQFLLKNARLLEKMVVELKDETTVIMKVSQELLSLPKCSRHVVTELLCSE